MTLGDKIRALRDAEGELRGLGREMSQQEVVRAMRDKLGASVSQSYLSQIETGSRPHLTQRTRHLLARFFGIHPGYLVTDPPGFHTELTSDLGSAAAPLRTWLDSGAHRFEADADLSDALRVVAGAHDPRTCLLLLRAVVTTPQLVERLLHTLHRSHD